MTSGSKARSGAHRDGNRAAAILSGALVLVVGLGVMRRAEAQSLRPNILFIFDTSGSMRESAAGVNVGEATNICPAGNTSRIYNLKSALRAALAQVGSDEANFGLMSFPQVVNNAFAAGVCSAGHYTSSPQQMVTTPNRVANGNNQNMATRFVTGCLMSTNLANENTFGPWYTMGAGQVLRVGVTTAAPGVAPVAANFDPPDANIPAIYRWLDNVELPTANGAVTDPELHAQGNTPLGRSLMYARVYFDGLIKPSDPRGACRQNVVVLITDGAETCDDATAPDATFNLATCTGGVAYDQFHPVAQACQLFRNSGIKTYMITDNGLPAADLANADRIAAAGGSTAAIRVSLNDANAAKAAVVGIIAETVPPAEVCNGKDDNCNGLIDEGVSNMCPLDLVTLKHCAVEIPNCLDDNCNGLIDEGFPPNACGKGAGCPIPPEICDGIDNNCDGNIDEGFDVGASCNNGLTGACRRVGLKECSADKMSTTCNLGGSAVAMEVCNGLDDDCNGLVDDGLGPAQGVGVDCGIQGQGCNKGVTQCVGGKIVCSSTSNPQAEVCNGKDDDCNGLVDDGVFPGVGDTCLCPGLDASQVGVGICKAGKKVCKGVDGIQCDGCVLPQPEICNGKDDDCDGVADHNATCPSGFGCQDGACAILCRADEFPCPTGYDCVNSYCVPNRCRNVQCLIDQKCDNATGSCVDLCYQVSCLSGQTCMGGKCLDCSNSDLLKCDPGQRCVNRQCVSDPCANVTCGTNEYCSAGTCVSLSCGTGCPAGQKCVAGACQTNGCDTMTCPSSGQYCDWATTTCKPDLCVTKTCPNCAKDTGECLPDPCGQIRCPTDGCWTCQVSPTGDPYCDLGPNCSYVKTVAANSGGGCACDVGGSPSSPAAALALLGLAGLGLAWRRRRSGT